MKNDFIDEPMLDPPGWGREDRNEASEVTRRRVSLILGGEPYAVLCTQGESQPYGSIVAFAASDDRRHLVFTTPIFTRKYRLLQSCSQVAMVIDTRARHPDSLMDVEGITATGIAREHEGDEAKPWMSLFLDRHPHLESFTRSGSSALFSVEVRRYFYVTRFQEVHQWVPSGS